MTGLGDTDQSGRWDLLQTHALHGQRRGLSVDKVRDTGESPRQSHGRNRKGRAKQDREAAFKEKEQDSAKHFLTS